MGLVDLDAVVVEVESDDELAGDVFGLGICQLGSETEADLLVDPLEEILFGGLRHQSVDISEGVFLRADTVVRGNDDVYFMVECTFMGFSLTGPVSSHVLRKGSIELGRVGISGKIIAALQEIVPAKDSEGLPDPEFFHCQEILGIGLAGLVEGELFGQLLPSDGDWERVFA